MIDKLLLKTSALGVTGRAHNWLYSNNIEYVGDLVQLEESYLRSRNGLGDKTIDDIKAKLKSLGLTLGMTVENWQERKKPRGY